MSSFHSMNKEIKANGAEVNGRKLVTLFEAIIYIMQKEAIRWQHLHTCLPLQREICVSGFCGKHTALTAYDPRSGSAVYNMKEQEGLSWPCILHLIHLTVSSCFLSFCRCVMRRLSQSMFGSCYKYPSWFYESTCWQ